MRYRFFMCKMEDPRFASRRAFVSKMLRQYLLDHGGDQIALCDTLPFNVKRTVELLRTASGEKAGQWNEGEHSQTSLRPVYEGAGDLIQ